jgi:hypothetical protein
MAAVKHPQQRIIALLGQRKEINMDFHNEEWCGGLHVVDKSAPRLHRPRVIGNGQNDESLNSHVRKSSTDGSPMIGLFRRKPKEYGSNQ